MDRSREWMSPLLFGKAEGEKWKTIALPAVRGEDMLSPICVTSAATPALSNAICLSSLGPLDTLWRERKEMEKTNTLWRERKEMEKIAPPLQSKVFPFRHVQGREELEETVTDAVVSMSNSLGSHNLQYLLILILKRFLTSTLFTT